MAIENKGIALVLVGVSVLFLICYISENSHLNVFVYAQVSQNISDNSTNGTSTNGTFIANVTTIQTANDSNTTNVIPYVLNVTNRSDTTSQAVNQLIQAISGGQSTSLQQVLDAGSNGNTSSPSLDQVIDAASKALNNQSSNNGTNNTSNNATIGLP
jgi:hypothetical protein